MYLQYVICLKVSRCGMIFMEPTTLGWECLVESWVKQLSPLISSHYKQMLKFLILRFGLPIIYFIRRCKLRVIFLKYEYGGYFYVPIFVLGNFSFK